MTTTWQLAGVLLLTATCAVAAADEVKTLVTAADYRTLKAARDAWVPAEDSPPVGLGRVAGRPAVLLPGNFRTNENWRVVWDVHGQWDITNCREVLLEVTGDPGGRMVVYFHSGGGWYRGQFHAPMGTHTLTAARSAFRTEGQPGSWRKIDTIRVSLTRGDGTEKTVRFEALRARISDPRVALYENDAGVGRERGIPDVARYIAGALERLEVDYELMNDADVAEGRLRGKKVAVLPLNPVLDPKAQAEIETFVKAGGKLIVCFSLPGPLGKLLGVRTPSSVQPGKDVVLNSIIFQDRRGRPKITVVQDSWLARTIAPAEGTRVVGHWGDADGRPTDRVAVTRNPNGYYFGHVLTRHGIETKDPLIIEMIGELWPDVFKDMYERRLARLGHVSGFKGVKDLAAAARNNAKGRGRIVGETNDRLEAAAGAARDAQAHLKRGDARRAAEVIEQARKKYADAFAASVPPRQGEFRAVWCHKPAGVRNMTWDEAMKTLADSGFNAVIPNMAWGAGAAYKSKLLPMTDEAKEKGDLLAQCLAAAKKHKIDVHVWKVNWATGWNMPKAFMEKLRGEGRLQQDPDGKTLRWLCPSQEVNRELDIESMVEIAREYDVAGIHFDYIRYPGPQGCYCPKCRQAFEAAYKLKVANWPTDVRTGPLKQQYLQFRRDNITAVVAEVSRRARKVRPKIKISAAVFPHWPSARDDIGQDWKLWIEKGYLDFVCPMQYTRSAAHFDEMTTQSLEWTGGRIPVITGIGATLGLAPDGTLQQVLIARKHNAAGFILFDYQPRLAEKHLPFLRLGATSTKTQPAKFQ